MNEPDINLSTPPAISPAGYVLHFKSEPGAVTPEDVRLKKLLKVLLRGLGFRAIEIIRHQDASRASATRAFLEARPSEHGTLAVPNNPEGSQHG
jgi:hypothetical protein